MPTKALNKQSTTFCLLFSQTLPLIKLSKSLGNSGLKISQVVLGAMSFGSVDKWTIPEEQALPIIKHAFDKGLNTWDTVSRRHIPFYGI